jgi:hypothetical protein
MKNDISHLGQKNQKVILQKKKKTRGGFIGQIPIQPEKTLQQEWQKRKNKEQAKKAEDAAKAAQLAQAAQAVAVSNAMNSNSNKKKKYINTLESIQQQIGYLIAQTRNM